MIATDPSPSPAGDLIAALAGTRPGDDPDHDGTGFAAVLAGMAGAAGPPAPIDTPADRGGPAGQGSSPGTAPEPVLDDGIDPAPTHPGADPAGPTGAGPQRPVPGPGGTEPATEAPEVEPHTGDTGLPAEAGDPDQPTGPVRPGPQHLTGRSGPTGRETAVPTGPSGPATSDRATGPGTGDAPATDPAGTPAGDRAVGDRAVGDRPTGAGPDPAAGQGVAPAWDRAEGPAPVPAATGAVTATTAAGPTTAAPTPAGPPPPPPPVADQLVARVAPLRHGPDGRTELLLELDPADLGPLRIEVVMSGGRLHLDVRAESGLTGDLLRRNLAELRQALDEAGVQVGDLQVSDHGRRAGGDPGDTDPDHHDRPTDRDAPAVGDQPRPDPGAPGAGAGLDLLL